MSAVLSLLLCGPVPGASKRHFSAVQHQQGCKEGDMCKAVGLPGSKARTLDAVWLQHLTFPALLEDFKSGNAPEKIQIACASVAQH